jgi:hypothetical protein
LWGLSQKMGARLVTAVPKVPKTPRVLE